MPAFSNANDKTAITAISVKILFFLMKSIMNINNLFIKLLYRSIERKDSIILLSLSESFNLRISTQQILHTHQQKDSYPGTYATL